MDTSNESGRIAVAVRAVRLARGLSQAELARLAGLSRQTINSIEAGRFVPGTEVALRLAEALGTRVEELFRLKGQDATVPVNVSPRLSGGERVVVGFVGGRAVAHPLRGQRFLLEGFAPADGIADPSGSGVELLVRRQLLEKTILVSGCDPTLAILAAYVARCQPDFRMCWLHSGSQRALDELAAGTVHVAGSHLRDRESGGCNVAQAGRALHDSGGLVVNYAAWEQGLAVAPGNPWSIRSAESLLQPGLRIVNREAGSGARQLMDDLLSDEKISGDAVSGYDRVVDGHMDVARAVADGLADAGITLRAVAATFGLHFVPLAEVRFDLVIPAAHLRHPAVEVMFNVLASASFRRELSALPGYEVALTGDTLLELKAA